MKNAHLVHECGGVPFPHFERLGGSQPWKPDPTDLVTSEAVVEEYEGIIVDSLIEGVSHRLGNDAGEIYSLSGPRERAGQDRIQVSYQLWRTSFVALFQLLGSAQMRSGTSEEALTPRGGR